MPAIYSKSFKVGVLGGGQLGRMLMQEAVNLDIKLFFLDPSADAPCSKIANGFTVGDFNDYRAVLDFGKDKDVITIEIEHVNVKALQELRESGIKVYPGPNIISMVQDKGIQKMFYRENGFPTSDFILVSTADEVIQELKSKALVQKLRKGGYDGRGVQVLKPGDDDRVFDAPSVLEDLVKIEKELSVIVSRNSHGEIASFPVVEMEFNPQANLVEFLFAPADIEPRIEKEARLLAEELISTLGMTGILAVEMFLDKSGRLLINEMAPRPHNSGHQTIEGNFTSQYAQHLRAILGLPPGNTELIMPSAMINLLGEPGYSGEVIYEGLNETLAIPGVYVHLYGKSETRPYRKMGHITILGKNRNELKQKSKLIKQTLKVKA